MMAGGREGVKNGSKRWIEERQHCEVASETSGSSPLALVVYHPRGQSVKTVDLLCFCQGELFALGLF